MTNVFISYRRSDTTSGYASWIYDRLAQTYGAEHVFMDIDSLSLGVDFVEGLQQALSQADVALVLIGPTWLDATDPDGRRRLDDDADFVRIEVGAALRANARVIPVLIDGASIPDSTQLPEDLRPLARRQALTFQRQGGAAISNLLVAIEEMARAERDEATAHPAPGSTSPLGHDAVPPPPLADHQRSGRSLAVVVVALVALAGIVAGALVAAGAFSNNSPPSAQAAARANATTQTRSASTSTEATTRSTVHGSTTSVRANGTTSCGGDLSVGPNTSCAFAQNVEQAYDHTTGGAQTVTAFSPVTGVTYTINCSSGSPHVCAGGTTHVASVYFTSGPAPTGSSSGIPADATACGGGVYVGANTSCDFAQNVQRAYRHTGGGDTNVTAFSPVTGQTYVIHCTGLSPHVCTGGTTNNASVYFH